MSQGFPTYTNSARSGEAGVNLVAKITADTFGWIFKRNHQEHDFGIDGYLEIVDERGYVTGKLIAVQIKHGSSFFREKNRWGYVYRGDLKHFNYLSNQQLPVLVIICEPTSKNCYWQLFDPKQIQLTPEAWKLTVPFDNTLHTDKSRLLELVGPLVDELNKLRDIWHVNQVILDSSFILYTFDSVDVASKNVSRVKSFFERLRCTKEFAFHNQGKVEFSFSGYDDDLRELFEIEEVREYVRLLDAALDSLFFFVRSQKPAHTLKLFVFCLCDAEWEGARSSPGYPQKVTFDTGMFAAFLTRHWPGLNLMLEWLGMSLEDNKRISFGIAQGLGIDTSEFEFVVE